MANNGDGAFSVFVGGEAGLSLANVFSQTGVPNPTALAVSGAGESVQVYATEAGEESAILLTSFGIPVTSIAETGAPAPLSDVLLVNGPGLETGLDIVSNSSASAAPGSIAGLGVLSPGGESGAPADTAVAATGGAQAAPLGATGLGQPAFASLASLLGKSTAEDLATALGVPLFEGTIAIGEPWAATRPRLKPRP